jgi:phosphoribosyl-ATP pyrophosphohydrolase/phosphoribosyl-AMP cyclohydrolase
MRDRDASLSAAGLDRLDWGKMDGLLPAIVQDVQTRQVLMLGYVSRQSLAATFDSGFVTFFSRSRQQLWQKGETSGNRLALVAMYEDCDADALLILAAPAGPTCHLGSESCFGDAPAAGVAWLETLAKIVKERAAADPQESYTARLLSEGLPRIAQKVGEEGVEIALAAVTRDEAGLTDEIADLLYHLTVLMEARSLNWEQVVAKLQERHR